MFRSELLSFSCDGVYRHLHSFPTRRSSDLASTAGGVAGCRGSPLHQSPATCGWVPGNGIVYRSEEHTSELQSLRHLVCRLLLEKKKKSRQRAPCRLCNCLSSIRVGRRSSVL